MDNPNVGKAHMYNVVLSPLVSPFVFAAFNEFN